VVVWNNYTDTDDGSRYIADMDEIRVTADAMVMVVAFVPRGDDVSMPPWAPRLPELGAVDAGVVAPTAEDTITSTTVADTSDEG